LRTLRICIIIGLVYSFGSLAQESDTSKPYYPGTNTYFPLLPGSYWVWQDSFYNAEAYQNALEMTGGEGATAFYKDSVTSLKPSQCGYSARIKRMSWYKEGRKIKPYIDTFFVAKDFSITNGYGVFAKLFPNIGDTMKNPPRKCIFTMYADQESTCIIAEVKNVFREKFKKGIGKIGHADLNANISNSNLIEYRIGNGPIVKKHWLMEAPEKK
jgi:hypothetical protein